MTQQLKTQTIAGQEITLEDGRRYYASRPWVSDGRKEYPVSITAEGADGHWESESCLTISKLSYEAANALLDAFNNEDSSLTGRVW